MKRGAVDFMKHSAFFVGIGFAIGALLPVHSAIASNTNNFGPISGVYATNAGAVLFSVTTSGRTGIPACGAAAPSRWAIDVTTSTGQAQAAALLSAYTLKKRIWVNGTGTCSIWSDTETAAYFNIED